MSASRVQSPDSGLPNGSSEPLSLEFALSLSRELPTSGLSTPKATLSPSSGIRAAPTFPEPRRPLAPSTSPSSLSKSRSPSNHRSQSHARSSVSASGSPPPNSSRDLKSEIRNIIIRSFAPRVVVHASTDTEEFVKGKGFKNGLYSLLRPYGERLQGKVVIRDSIGSSKVWDDFGIRFVNSQDKRGTEAHRETFTTSDLESRSQFKDAQESSRDSSLSRDPSSGTPIDQVLQRFLQSGNGNMNVGDGDHSDHNVPPYESKPQSSPMYPIYLRKLLSSDSLVPYEMFTHPVACMIAVSSHHRAPIEALRQLYANTGHGGSQIPAWVGTEYLRYYVLIHDEEKDDITKSTALFDLMKRHFGLHCHLLRLRGTECVQTDDDSSKVPLCEWLSAEEELDSAQAKDYTDDFEIEDSYIPESDVTAVRALLREMVSQSIIPFMENRVMTWNDQVASRRRGISGRFMSLSKRWTGFGSSKSTTSGTGTAAATSGSNYDHQRGFYPPETPEATMRQLGDYAFMLRDWKLAYSTYDFLRTDFGHDKAWGYHAAANEMAAITSLLTLTSQSSSSKGKLETFDQMLDTATYSYLTRCSMPANAVRCLTLAIELLRTRGPIAVDDAARWTGRLLELGVLSTFAQTLMAERLADCYGHRDVPSPTRRRQAALWNVLASDSWRRLDRPAEARSRFSLARKLYEMEDQPDALQSFALMQPLWQRLSTTLYPSGLDTPATLIDLDNVNSPESSTDQESEQLHVFDHPTKLDYVDKEGFTLQDAERPIP